MESSVISCSLDWSCRNCTLLNPVTNTKCSICDEPRDAFQSSNKREHSEEYWSCTHCTLENSPNANRCAACMNFRTTNPKKSKTFTFSSLEIQCEDCGNNIDPEEIEEHMSMHRLQKELQEEEEWKILRVKYGMDNRPTHSNAYVEQYIRSLEIDLIKQKISQSEFNQKKEHFINTLKEPENVQTFGIMNALRDHFKKTSTTKMKSEVMLCSDNVNFYGSWRPDRGWGCGYRNIQAIASHLLQHALYSKLVFGGVGYVPKIPSIQEFIEKAWNAGYDKEGAAQLRYSLCNSRKMIGTSECFALFRYFGINAKVVDFHSVRRSAAEMEALLLASFGSNKKSTASTSSTSNQMTNKSTTSATTQMSQKKVSPYKPNKELMDWVWNYFSSRKNSFCPPLYFQHDGHSRCIVGIEKKGKKTNLLIFDPSHHGPSVLEAVKNGKLQSLRRCCETLTRDRYQILYIDGIAKDKHSSEFKKFTTTKVTSK